MGSHTCSQCRGVCVFSDLFFRKYTESRSIRKIAQEKFYKKEFELLRAFTVEKFESIIPEYSPEEDEEEEDKCERSQVYKLLEKYRHLSPEQLKIFSKVHSGASSLGKWKGAPLIRTNKGNKILSCYHRHHPYESHYQRYNSRQEKNRDVTFYASNIELF